MAIEFDNLHFNPNYLRTHNCDINIIMSGREDGKSTGMLKMLLDEYEKNKSRAVWLLREVGQLNKEFYDSFLDDFDDRQFKMFRNRVHYVDKEGVMEEKPVIYFFGVSTGNKRIKQTKLTDIENIVYDEFLIDHTLPNERYLPNEAEVLFKILDTVQRRSKNYKTKLWMLGNPYSMINPYFPWLKIEAKEVERRLDKIYKPHGNRLLVAYRTVHPDLLERKENTTYGYFSKLNTAYYEHTFHSKQKYKPMFPVVPFKKYNEKTYLFKIKIENKVLEFWNTPVCLYIAETEYKKDRPIAMDFDSFEGSAIYNNPSHPLYDTIKKVKHMISSRIDVVLESSNIENAVKLFAKQ